MALRFEKGCMKGSYYLNKSLLIYSFFLDQQLFTMHQNHLGSYCKIQVPEHHSWSAELEQDPETQYFGKFPSSNSNQSSLSNQAD